MDLLICVKSFVSKKIASSVLVQENVLQILFELLLSYRDEDDTNYRTVLSQESCYHNLPKLGLCIEIIRMIFETGFFRENDDANHYGSIILELNLNAFMKFLEMVCHDKRHILRSFRSSFNLNLCESSVGKKFMKILESIHQLIGILKRVFAHAYKNEQFALLQDMELGFMECFMEYFRDRVDALRNRATGDRFSRYTITFKTFTVHDYPNGDNRVFNISGRHTFKDVLARINDRYSYLQPLIPLYKPGQGELVTIDSDEVYDKILQEAFGSNNARTEAEIKIYLKHLTASSSSNSSNSFFGSYGSNKRSFF